MRTTVLAAAGIVLLAGCGSAATAGKDAPAVTPTPTTEFEAPDPVTDEDIDILALETVWAQQRLEICPLYRDALDTGVDPEALKALAVSKYAEGAGESFGPAVQARLIELIDEC